MVPREANVLLKLDGGPVETDYKFIQNDNGLNKLNIRLQSKNVDIIYSRIRLATITFKKSDGTIVQGDNVEIKPDKLVYSLRTGEVSCPGIVSASLQLYDENNNRLSTFPFTFEVIEDLINDDVVLSTNDFPILQSLISEVRSMQQTLGNFQTVSDFKSQFASAIADKGIPVNGSDTLTTLYNAFCSLITSTPTEPPAEGVPITFNINNLTGRNGNIENWVAGWHAEGFYNYNTANWRIANNITYFNPSGPWANINHDIYTAINKKIYMCAYIQTGNHNTVLFARNGPDEEMAGVLCNGQFNFVSLLFTAQNATINIAIKEQAEVVETNEIQAKLIHPFEVPPELYFMTKTQLDEIFKKWIDESGYIASGTRTINPSTPDPQEPPATSPNSFTYEDSGELLINPYMGGYEGKSLIQVYSYNASTGLLTYENNWLQNKYVGKVLEFYNYPSGTYRGKASITAVGGSNTVNISMVEGLAPVNGTWIKRSQYKQSLGGVRVSWDDLEPTKGVYNFDVLEIDENMAYFRENGIKAVLRFYMDWPGAAGHKDIPEWLYNELGSSAGGTYWSPTWNSGGFSPNYANPTIINYHRRLVEALADRYANDDTLWLIEFGVLGHWGELHSQDFPADSVANQYFQAWLDEFPTKKFACRRGLNIAAQNKLGYYNDMIGNEPHLYNRDYLGSMGQNDNGYYYNQNIVPFTGWRSNMPNGGEFDGTIQGINSDHAFTDINSNVNYTITKKYVTDMHLSWVRTTYDRKDTSSIVNDAYIEDFFKTIGYRLLPMALSVNDGPAGGTTPVLITLKNKGVAKLHMPHHIELSIYSGSTQRAVQISTIDVSQLDGGAQATYNLLLNIPAGLSSGGYDLYLALVEGTTPNIEIPINTSKQGKRYKIGTFNIT